MLITDLAAFEFDSKAGLFRLIETAPGVSVDEVKAKTAATILIDRAVTVMAV
jgi:acyl CoA:acetate/3-ketoacid CoA transferase beta subunit